MTRWSIAELTAVDKDGRVIKSPDGALIVDPRQPGVRGYRVRWRVGPAGGEMAYRNRSFKKHRLEEARRFRQLLLDAAAAGADADDSGLPVGAARAAGPSQPRTVEEAAARWADEVTGKARAVNTATNIWNQVGFAIETMRANDGDGLVWDPDRKQRSLFLSELTPETCVDVLMVRRFTDRRAHKGYRRALADYERYQLALAQPSRPGPRPRAIDLPAPPEGRVSARTEEAFSDVMGQMFRDFHERHWTEENLWTSAARVARSAEQLVINDAMVLTIDQGWELADRIGSREGGERYRVPVLVALESAPRVEELYALDRRSFTEDFGELRIERAEVVVSRRYNPAGGPIETRGLKHRPEGDFRAIDQSDDVREALEQHFALYVPEGGRFLSNPDGSPIVHRKGWVNRYFKPAVAEMFAESDNDYLRNTLLKDLRKAGINWWLTNGMTVAEAALLAGHSPQTLTRYYARANEAARSDFRSMINTCRPGTAARRRFRVVS